MLSGIFTCPWKPSQENEDPGEYPEQEAFIAFRLKKKNSVKNEWTRDGEELTRRIRVSLTRFVCQSPQPRVAHLCSWERLLSSQYRDGTFHMGAFWSDSGTTVWEEGQCDLPAFLKFLQLKLYNVPKCSVSWTPSQTNDVPRLPKRFSPISEIYPFKRLNSFE